MAGLNQVLNLGGTAGPLGQGLGAPTARPGTPTGAPEPLLGQAMAGMQPGGQEFMPGMDPMAMMEQELQGPELAHLFGRTLPAMSLMDVMRLLQMKGTWGDASPPYGAIL